MKLKEKYYERRILNILKEYNEKFELLTESKKNILITKLGLSEKLAELFDEVCGKLSVWLANKLLKYYYDRYKNMAESDVTDKMILNVAREEINNRIANSTTIIRILNTIMDYIQVGLNGNKTSLDDLGFFEIHNKAKEWHNSLNVGSDKINYIEKNPIIIDFRNENGEGYYWVDLETNFSSEECERMGHCGRTNLGNLYSLRSYRKVGNKFTLNKSHLTAAISDNGILYQLKGEKNSKPKEEYHKYILPLFSFEVDFGDMMSGSDEGYLIQGFGNEYDPRQDFKITDLPDNTIITLFQERPELFTSRTLKKKLYDLGLSDQIQNEEFEFDTEVKIPFNELHYFLYDSSNTFDRNHWSKSIYTYNDILSGNIEAIEDFTDFDWERLLEYSVDDENKKIIENLVNSWVEHEGGNPNDLTLLEKIEKYDNEQTIETLIKYAYIQSEKEIYLHILQNNIYEALENYGEVINVDIENKNVVLKLDFEKMGFSFEDEDFIEIIEDDCEHRAACVLSELISTGNFEIPNVSVPSRYDIDFDEDDFNQILRNNL